MPYHCLGWSCQRIQLQRARFHPWIPNSKILCNGLRRPVSELPEAGQQAKYYVTNHNTSNHMSKSQRLLQNQHVFWLSSKFILRVYLRYISAVVSSSEWWSIPLTASSFWIDRGVHVYFPAVTRSIHNYNGNTDFVETQTLPQQYGAWDPVNCCSKCRPQRFHSALRGSRQFDAPVQHFELPVSVAWSDACRSHLREGAQDFVPWTFLRLPWLPSFLRCNF